MKVSYVSWIYYHDRKAYICMCVYMYMYMFCVYTVLRVLAVARVISVLTTCVFCRDARRLERDVMASFSDCPFIVTLHCAFQSENKLYFILDYIGMCMCSFWLIVKPCAGRVGR